MSLQRTATRLDQRAANYVARTQMAYCMCLYVYWRIQLIKTQLKASNQELRADYKKRASLAEQ